MWVRIPNLLVEYYDKCLLWQIGDRIGHTLHIDVATEEMSYEKYARICVEVDLSKSLILNLG